MKNHITYFLLGFIFLAITSLEAKAQLETITGPIQARDGDSIFIDGKKIRLQGIDVPELKQQCTVKDSNRKIYLGSEAKAWINSYVAGKVASCQILKKGRYGRLVSVCFINGENISEVLVKRGYAAVDPRYDKRYLPIMKKAKAKKIGMWRAQCDLPWVWRKKEKKRIAKEKKEREKAEKEKAEKDSE